MLYNNSKNGNIKRIKGKVLRKYVCKDCHSTFYNYDYNLCPYCESLNSGDESKVLYIIADCFSYANGKPEQMSGYTVIVCNDRFDLEDKYNIEYVNRKAFKNTTNNYGELTGILDGLEYFLDNEIYECYDKVIVISDSEYCILGARDRMAKWRSKGWTNTSGEVKNKELWMLMWDLVQEIKATGVELEFRHQKGHVGKNITKEEDPIVYLQERCDLWSTQLKEQILQRVKNK